jgi:hypothetical protein
MKIIPTDTAHFIESGSAYFEAIGYTSQPTLAIRSNASIPTPSIDGLDLRGNRHLPLSKNWQTIPEHKAVLQPPAENPVEK